MDKEIMQFQADLLASVKDMKANKPAKENVIAVSEITEARNTTGLSQNLFADLMGVSVRTLQDWEQGRRTPSKAARTLLKVAKRHPEVLRELAG
ncbi:helix-turn-helix domain-containing protein [Methylomonas methanica]|uniref:Transcriptional regulator, XRE family n=1 Tax=Methylomonas methanica (strain DSM 25384 / MC09) TaxID=857087 RepID=G0A223_METMM|nr:type II toxin-antitoxin system MqsA family antitoxin [Methylomonas methanica]AEG02566.1 transcriptional regulator, XRE family [Methylomonas methanica MC09]